MTIEAYIPKFGYINTTLGSSSYNTPVFADTKILELYGNAGTLLNDPECEFKEENYTVFEFDAEAIEEGREMFPNADFREWNHHNQMNNPEGNIDEPMPWSSPDEKFDIIFSYMKTGNLDPEILKNIIIECYEHLNVGGAIVFGTFIREVALNYFIVRRTHEYGVLPTGLVEDTENADVICLIDNDNLQTNVERVATSGEDAVVEATHYSWFWNAQYLDEYLSINLPDTARIVSRRLPPMWCIHNPIFIEKTG
jgi:hypothetical protein